MKRNLPTNSTCAAVLGVLIAALSGGCANETSTAEEPATSETQQPMVVARPITPLGGCSAQAVFDISGAQASNFVAIDASNVNDLSAQLYAVDAAGHETRVEQSLFEATEAMQSAINSYTNFVSAEQLARRAARELVASRRDATSTEAVEHMDSARVISEASSQRAGTSSASHVANQAGSAHQSQQASQAASTNAAQNAHQQASQAANVNEFLNIWDWGLGNYRSAMAYNQGSVGNSAYAANNAAAQSSAAAAANNSFFIADSAYAAQSYADSAFQHSDVASANRAARTTVVSSHDAYERQTEALDQAASHQQASAAGSAQSSAASVAKRAYALRNLDALSSQRYVLNVQFASNRAHEAVRVFQGANSAQSASAVSAFGDAFFAFPGCGI